jgi:N-acetylmuramoyl-L-alanine amidase
MADCISNPCSSRGAGSNAQRARDRALGQIPDSPARRAALCAEFVRGPRRTFVRQGAAALLTAGVCLAASAAGPASAKVKNVRFWSLGDVTRVAIEVSADFKYRQDRLPDPDRIFFDIPARPETTDRKILVIPVGDSLLKQIRVAETQPGVTRVVLDVEAHDPPVQFTASQLSSPSRLIVELRLKAAPPLPEVPRVEEKKASAEVSAQSPPEVRGEAPAQIPAQVDVKPPPRTFIPPAAKVAIAPAPPLLTPLVTPAAPAQARASLAAVPLASVIVRPNLPGPPGTIAPDVKPRVSVPADSQAQPAKRNANGEESLTRVLGLKLGRVVIDPGHGGHDEGTRGPTGLSEKEVVLDIAKRLGALLEQRLGTEVVYTREDDTFIPLEERTRIANDHRADLFLSIHANSSPVRSVSGVESYYLNFTTSKTALEVAARENANAQSSIFDLQQVLQKIAVKDKIDESREFASRIQTALFAASAKGNPAVKNRGIKQAPFVVLIGASMPSVLAEIGFLTNASDEALLRNPTHRQKIAEALYKGIASYADTLSHFTVARRE